MYTANTIASAAEALGMSLPGDSSFPAEYPEKLDECDSIGPVMRNLLEKNILPRDIMTRSAFENAMVCSSLLHSTSLRCSISLTRFLGDLRRVLGPDDHPRRLDERRAAPDRRRAFGRDRIDYR